MKDKILKTIAIGAVLVAVAIAADDQRVTETYVRALAATTTPSVAATKTLTIGQQAWLGALEWCESNGEPGAVNPKDSDGTPSYGLLQFKPGTYSGYAKLYGFASTTDYMDPSEQVAIVTQMILRGNIDWHQQFPACVERLGLPPVSTKAIASDIDR